VPPHLKINTKHSNGENYNAFIKKTPKLVAQNPYLLQNTKLDISNAACLLYLVKVFLSL